MSPPIPTTSPNVYKISPNMISLEKWKILTPLRKLATNVGDLGKIIVATGFDWLPKCKKSPNLVTLPLRPFAKGVRCGSPRG